MEYCDILALSVLAFGFDTCFLSLSISFLLAKSTKTMQNELFKKVKYECTTMRELQFHLVFGFIDFVEHTQTGHNQNNRSLRGEEQVYVQCKYCHWQRLFTSIYEYLLRFCIESVPICVCIFLALFPFLIESIAIKCIFSHYVSYIVCFLYLPMNVLVILYSRFFMRSRRFCLLFDFLFHTLAEDRKKK